MDGDSPTSTSKMVEGSFTGLGRAPLVLPDAVLAVDGGGAAGFFEDCVVMCWRRLDWDAGCPLLLLGPRGERFSMAKATESVSSSSVRRDE